MANPIPTNWVRSILAIDLLKATAQFFSISSAEEILKNWAVALSKSIAKIDRTQLVGIGFAMPGPFDYAAGIALFTKGVVKYQNLYGINVSERIRELLALPAGLDLRYMNDATAFGVGEAWLGEASGVNRSISITLGTGLGSALDRKSVV